MGNSVLNETIFFIEEVNSKRNKTKTKKFLRRSEMKFQNIFVSNAPALDLETRIGYANNISIFYYSSRMFAFGLVCSLPLYVYVNT